MSSEYLEKDFRKISRAEYQERQTLFKDISVECVNALMNNDEFPCLSQEEVDRIEEIMHWVDHQRNMLCITTDQKKTILEPKKGLEHTILHRFNTLSTLDGGN